MRDIDGNANDLLVLGAAQGGRFAGRPTDNQRGGPFMDLPVAELG
jgi:hypothetical protein